MLWHSLASSSNVSGTLLPVANWWLTLHVIQLPLCALMGLAISLLLDRRRGLAATISRLAAAVFVVFYNAGDVSAGVTTSILARAAVELPAAQQTALVEAIIIIFGDTTKKLLFGTGIYAGDDCARRRGRSALSRRRALVAPFAPGAVRLLSHGGSPVALRPARFRVLLPGCRVARSCPTDVHPSSAEGVRDHTTSWEGRAQLTWG